MRFGREQEIDHLYRRAGFGASQEEVESLHQSVVCQLCRIGGAPSELLRDPRRCGFVHRPAGIRRGDGAQRERLPAREQHSRRPAALAVPHGAHAASAAGEDGALLAQPLRHGLQQDRERDRAAPSATRCWRPSRPRMPAGAGDRSSCFANTRSANFRDLLVEVAKDPAMLVWLDGRSTPGAPAGELRARADGALHDRRRAATRRATSTPARGCSRAGTCSASANRDDPQALLPVLLQRRRSTTPRRRRSAFPIYADGRRTIPARAARRGMQDGIDLIDRAGHGIPRPAPRLARKLWTFFVSEVDAPDECSSTRSPAAYYLRATTTSRRWCATLLLSPQFKDPASYFARYSWPVEFVVRAAQGGRLARASRCNSALDPLVNMGQQLFEPPDVNGWELGPGWFSTAACSRA